MSLSGKKYFSITPNNNTTVFDSQSNQNQLGFSLPVAPYYLDTKSLRITGRLALVSDEANTGFSRAGNSNDNGSFDNVVGLQSMIERVETGSKLTKMNIETNNDYSLFSKYLIAGKTNNNDIKKGSHTICNLSGVNMRQGRKWVSLDGVNTANARSSQLTPFSIKLLTGMFSMNYTPVHLGSNGGLDININLSSIENMLVNITNDQVLTTGAKYVLKDVRLTGRYVISTQKAPDAVVFKTYNNLLQVLQTSRDVVSFSPQYRSLDCIVMTFNKNSKSRNTFDGNFTDMDEIPGLREMLFSKSGMRHPLEYPVITQPPQDEYTATNPASTKVSGNAEQVWFNLIKQQGKYTRSGHSMINPDNTANTLVDKQLQNAGGYQPHFTACNNYQPVIVNYQYGFIGYNENFQGKNFSTDVASLLKLAGSNVVDTSFLTDNATMNNLLVYNVEYSPSKAVKVM